MSVINRALIVANTAYMIRQFNMNNIALLQGMGYQVEVACNFINGNPASKEVIDDFVKQLKSMDVICHQIPIIKSPLKIKKNYKAYTILLRLMREKRYAFIHCQTPVGGVLARLAANKTHTPSIYMVHGFHFHKGASLFTWLLYYPVERYMSSITDALVVINQEDYQLAQKRMKAKKLYYVPGVGIDVDALRVQRESECGQLTRSDIGVPENAILVLSVGELNKNKNHEMVVKAVAQLSNLHYVIAGEGVLKEHLLKIAQEHGVADRVHLLGFRKDVQVIYQLADVYCHPSFREGLSVAVMEAMAAGLPIVCSDIRGNQDLIDDGRGGILVKSIKASEFTAGINYLIEDKNRRELMANYNRLRIEAYDISNINSKMKDIYQNMGHY